ncbi:LUD domain-containing protein [Candidatus Acetothermia bacterium]|jgi:iron-sulfur cluster protein|nr:LUD domain-containing protein [Candidatus Acetothermia bacterium]MCI2432657.1 LUD domain-containing protein [Candidatus Acetothermia bacterium]MCI2435917.1 LUD domain-containing protein [Candidatus Acetothermia bacterium]
MNEFSQKIAQSLQDDSMHTALSRAGLYFDLSRSWAFADIKDLNALKRRAREIKEFSIEHLDELLAQLKASITRNGGNFYLAQNAQEANEYMLKLVRERGVKKAVKSKSMVTEELEMNKHLEAADVEVIETDLGERIIQLAGERPFHIIGPAIHKPREAVGKLFADKLGVPYTDNPYELTKIARASLRQSYLDADMGITGANFAVAQTGTFIVITNEGNDRLTMTLPKIHVTVTGIEKVVPTLADVLVLLKLLPRSATAQKMTSYLSLVTPTSPLAPPLKREGAGGLGQDREVHVVLVDNGRSRMRADTKFREALYCIRCGSCMNICPAFRAVGGHAYAGQTYMGVIGAIWTAFVDHNGQGDLARARELASLCMTCGLCAQECPVQIDLPWRNAQVLSRVNETLGHKPTDRLKSFAYRKLLPNRKRLAGAVRAWQLGTRVGLPKIAHAILVRTDEDFAHGLEILQGHRFAERFLHERLSELLAKNANSPVQLQRVGYFVGCGIDLLYPDAGAATVKILQHNGWAVHCAEEHICCGAPAFYYGDEIAAKTLARSNIEILEKLDADVIVSDEATCSGFLKNYPKLLRDDPAYVRRAEKLVQRIRELSEFLSQSELKPFRSLSEIVTYHAPCHLTRTQNLGAKPLEIIKQIPGLEIKELEKADHCCGGAGTYSTIHHRISLKILDGELERLKAAGAQTLMTPCSACLIQHQYGCRKHKLEIQTAHLSELLARAWNITNV